MKKSRSTGPAIDALNMLLLRVVVIVVLPGCMTFFVGLMTMVHLHKTLVAAVAAIKRYHITFQLAGKRLRWATNKINKLRHRVRGV